MAACWLFDRCPCRTAICRCDPEINDECPVYRWFRNLIKDREGLFTADDVSTIMAAKGRSDKRFKAWETIRYSPSEVGSILKECLGTDHHEDEGSD